MLNARAAAHARRWEPSPPPQQHGKAKRGERVLGRRRAPGERGPSGNPTAPVPGTVLPAQRAVPAVPGLLLLQHEPGHVSRAFATQKSFSAPCLAGRGAGFTPAASCDSSWSTCPGLRGQAGLESDPAGFIAPQVEEMAEQQAATARQRPPARRAPQAWGWAISRLWECQRSAKGPRARSQRAQVSGG